MCCSREEGLREVDSGRTRVTGERQEVVGTTRLSPERQGVTGSGQTDRGSDRRSSPGQIETRGTDGTDEEQSGPRDLEQRTGAVWRKGEKEGGGMVVRDSQSNASRIMEMQISAMGCVGYGWPSPKTGCRGYKRTGKDSSRGPIESRGRADHSVTWELITSLRLARSSSVSSPSAFGDSLVSDCA